MAIQTGIAASQERFAGTLHTKPAEGDGNATGEHDAAVGNDGDRVTISKQGRALAAGAGGGVAKSDSSSDQSEEMIKRIEEQIKKLEKEIKELEKSDLPEKQKRSQIQSKQTMLMQLQDQLLKAKEEQAKALGTSSGGGTRAQGFASSLT